MNHKAKNIIRSQQCLIRLLVLFFLLNVLKPQQQATYGKNDSLGLMVRRVTSHHDGKADL